MRIGSARFDSNRSEIGQLGFRTVQEHACVSLARAAAPGSSPKGPTHMRRLTVEASLESLSAVSEFVKEVAADAELDKAAAYRLRLAIIELATNIATYGYDMAGVVGTIELEAELGKEALTLTLEDNGVAYDPAQSPAPDDLDQPLEDRRIGGLGVYLAVNSVDVFRYERVNGKNRTTLTMKRTTASAVTSR